MSRNSKDAGTPCHQSTNVSEALFFDKVARTLKGQVSCSTLYIGYRKTSGAQPSLQLGMKNDQSKTNPIKRL
jgi:hypothetical protein